MNILTPGQNEADELYRRYKKRCEELEENPEWQCLLGDDKEAVHKFLDSLPYWGSIPSALTAKNLATPHIIMLPAGDWQYQKYHGNR